MRGNELLDKMELIDPAFVEAADKRTYKRKSTWIKWGVTAACLCLVVSSVFALRQQLKSKNSDFPAPQTDGGATAIYPNATEIPDDTTDVTVTPPSVTNSPVALHPDAISIPPLQVNAGFEGYMCYDISELDNSNPWSEDMSITTMPVYKNLAFDSTGAGIPTGLSEEEMAENLAFIVNALKLTVMETEIIRDGYVLKDGEVIPDDAPTQLVATTNNGEITVYANSTITYRLPDKGLSLPNEYHFTNNDTTDEEAKQVLSYLTDIYGNLLKTENPIGESFGDYNIFGEFYRSYIIYDASGDDISDILNYHFGRIYLYPTEEGYLYLIRINNGLSVAEKIKEYPIISVTEATERLVAGNYQTSVPVAFPGEESIGKVELVYRTGPLEEILLPYYRFYVLLPDSISESASSRGLKTYGIYYVPALPNEYIVNMPIYDGHFN